MQKLGNVNKQKIMAATELCVLCDKVIESTSMPVFMKCDRHFVHPTCVKDPLKDFDNCPICAQQQQQDVASATTDDGESWLDRLGAIMEPPPPEPKLSRQGLIPPVTAEGQYLATGRRIYAIMDENNECAFSLIHQRVPPQQFPYSLCHMAAVERVTLDDFLGSGYEWEDLREFPEIADRTIVGCTTPQGRGDPRPRGFVNLLRLGLHPEHATQLDFPAIQAYYGMAELFPNTAQVTPPPSKEQRKDFVKIYPGHVPIRIPKHLLKP